MAKLKPGDKGDFLKRVREEETTMVMNRAKRRSLETFLLKGLTELYKSLKDPHNIPRKWKSNPNYVLDTFRRFGEIPRKCVRKLRKGKACLGS